MSTMSRFASQSLNYYRKSSSSISLLSPRIFAQHHHYRYMSGKSDSDGSSPSEGDSISKAMTKLDEAVQNFVIRGSAPDWLPFVPGASYWVPPPDPKHPCTAIIEILNRVSKSNRRRISSLSDGEMMPFSSHLHGSAQASPMSVEVVMLENPEGSASDSDEEEY